MRLTVLGASASYAGAGQACAGHLVSSGETDVLLDCGHGVLANLGHVLDPMALDGVFISHAHPDHLVDLYSLQALLRYAPEGPAPPLDLFCPAGTVERMSCLLSEDGGREFAEAFRTRTLVAGEPVVVGALAVEPVAVDHGDDAFGFRVSDGAGTLFYTSDARHGPELVRAAEGTDVLLAEATLPAAYQGRAPHLTGEEAASVAEEAGVGRLVLTHLWPTADHGAILDGARRRFSGETTLAREFLEVDIG